MADNLNVRKNPIVTINGEEYNMANFFQVSSVFQLIPRALTWVKVKYVKYENWGKDLPIWHQTKRDNWFMVKCMFKWRVLLITCLLYLACLIQCNTNLGQKSRSKSCND